MATARPVGKYDNGYSASPEWWAKLPDAIIVTVEQIEAIFHDMQHVGGEGVVRELELLEPAEVSLLTERRRHGPPGLEGGCAGAPGRNLVDGESVPSKTTMRLDAGRVLTIETPGGGGWGSRKNAK